MNLKKLAKTIDALGPVSTAASAAAVSMAGLGSLGIYRQVIDAAVAQQQREMLEKYMTGAYEDGLPFDYERWDETEVLERPMRRMFAVASGAYERAVELLGSADCPLSEAEVKSVLSSMTMLWHYGCLLEDRLHEWHLSQSMDCSLSELGAKINEARRNVRIIYGRASDAGDMPPGISWVPPERVLERTLLGLRDSFEHLCYQEKYIRLLVGPLTRGEVRRASAEFPRHMIEEIVDLNMAAGLKIESNFEARVFEPV